MEEITINEKGKMFLKNSASVCMYVCASQRAN
jgi:hypothetical protein